MLCHCSSVRRCWRGVCWNEGHTTEKKPWSISWVTRWIHDSPTKTLSLWTKPVGCPCTPPLKDVFGSVFLCNTTTSVLPLQVLCLSAYKRWTLRKRAALKIKKQWRTHRDDSLLWWPCSRHIETHLDSPLSINNVYPSLKWLCIYCL